MSIRDVKLDDFFLSLKIKKHINIVDKMGLQDTSISIFVQKENNCLIKEFFIFTSDGHVVLNTKFAKKYICEDKKFLGYIKNIAKSMYAMSQAKTNNFFFQKILYHNLKLTFLIKDGLIFTSVFGESANASYIKLYLLHMYIAFVNFNGVLIDAIKGSVGEIDYPKSEFFQLKIYELYFVKHITNHFDRIFKFLVKKEEMYLSYIKFKNMYVVDLTNGEILFDILSIRNSNKNKKFYRNEKLWQEIIHHSKHLMDLYKVNYGTSFDNKDAFYRFVKLECTSTYPRYTFIVKFIPILKGISIIHVYSQKKLSRMTDNSEHSLIPKGYKEIDLLYGTDVKNNNNIEFRYTEPKKLQEIEKFLIEYFISIRTNSDVFNDINHELKYFDYSIITSINEILVSHREIINNAGETSHNKITGVDSLINKINTKFYDNFTNMKNNGAEKSNDEDLKPIELNKPAHGKEKDMTNFSNFLLIKKENILNELFEDGELSKSIVRNKENSGSVKQADNMNETNGSQMNNNEIGVETPHEDKVTIKYVEDDDGWAMRTKQDGFGFGLNKNEDKEKKKIQSKVSLNNDVTLNLSKMENDATNNGKDDVSFDFSRKFSIISKNEEESEVYFNPRAFLERNSLSNNNILPNDTYQSIDHLMSEMENKDIFNPILNVFPTEENFKTNPPLLSSQEYINPEIPKHNNFGLLVKKTQEISRMDNSMSQNNSQQAKINFKLNVNVPVVNQNSPKNNNNFFRKETNPISNNKLPLFDAVEVNNNYQLIKFKSNISENKYNKMNTSLDNLKLIEQVPVNNNIKKHMKLLNKSDNELIRGDKEVLIK